MTLLFKSSVIVCAALGFTSQALSQLPSSSEQSQSEVSVMVTDSEGGRISGAELIVRSQVSGRSLMSVTNEGGQAVFKLSSEEYEFLAMSPGFKGSAINMRVQPPEPIHLSIKMHPGETRVIIDPSFTDVPTETEDLPDLLVQEKPLPSHSVPPPATEASATTRIPACGKLPSGEKWIGWGSHGPQFRVPKQGFKVSGSDVDVDYVRFIITSTDHDGVLELWFGSMALGPRPRPKLLKASIAVTRMALLNGDGATIGWDTRGEKGDDHTRWRHFAVGLEGAVYEDVSAADIAAFDRIIETACIASTPIRSDK